MRIAKLAAVALVVVLAAPAWASTYYEIVSYATLASGSGGTSLQAGIVDGNAAYFQLSSSPAITRVNPINGVQTTTTLLNAAGWAAASGGASGLTTWYGFSSSGSYLQFTDTSSDQVWRVDKTTGAIAAYATQANIMATTGLTKVSLLSPADTAPSGEMAFYEGESDSILLTAGANNVQTLLSAAQLTAATGNSIVSGGLGFDLAGNLYWGSNTSKDLWRRNTDGTLTQVLTTAQILAVSGGASVSWKDVFGAPDGKM
jgi:hypothetical protein